MSDELKERSDALLADLKSNRRGELGGDGSDSTGLATVSEGDAPGAKPKKKRKLGKFFLFTFLLGLIGGGVYVGLVQAGKVKNPAVKSMIANLTKPKPKTPAEQLAQQKPAEAVSEPAAPEEPKVEEEQAPPKKKPKPVPQPTIDPEVGAKKIALVWDTMEPDAVVKVAKTYKDAEFARVLSQMETEKVGAILAALDPKRAAKVSRQIEQMGSVIPPQTDES